MNEISKPHKDVIESERISYPHRFTQCCFLDDDSNQCPYNSEWKDFAFLDPEIYHNRGFSWVWVFTCEKHHIQLNTPSN